MLIFEGYNTFFMNFLKPVILTLVLLLAIAKVFSKEKEPTTTFLLDKTINNGEDPQLKPFFNGLSASFSGGFNFYYGDIADYNIFPKTSQFKTNIKTGFKVSIARDIIGILGIKINYQIGNLIGTRKTGKNSSTVSFENSFNDVSIQARVLISDLLFAQTKHTRFKLSANIGLGYMWYRTKQYDAETLQTKDYEGYIPVEGTESLSQKTLSAKGPKATTLTIPYGLTIGYQLSHKIDLHLDFTQSSTNTDRLDAFRREWTSKDKYNYIGLGITYNLNRTLKDGPSKKSKKKKGSKNNNASSDTSKPKSKKGLFGKKKASKEDELLNVRLKLFETQLKLFEMQYLLGK